MIISMHSFSTFISFNNKDYKDETINPVALAHPKMVTSRRKESRKSGNLLDAILTGNR